MNMTHKAVTHVSVTNDVSLITLDNIPNKIKMIANIFTTIAKENINIDMISQSAPYRGVINISFTLPDSDLMKIIKLLSRFKKDIPDLRTEVNSNNCKLSIYGQAMRDLPGVAAKLFSVLSEHNIEIKLVTTSEVDISYLIDEKDIERAMESIKEEFNI